MAEILIKAIDANNANSIKDRRGCYKKGYPVTVMPDGHNWGIEERLPKFVIIKCPDISIVEAIKYIDMWKDNFSYTVVSQNAELGKYTVRITETNASASGLNVLTENKVSSYLSSWGCDNTSYSSPYYQFDISLWNAVRSNAFWKIDVTDILFSLIEYNSSTGIGKIKSVVPSNFKESEIIKKILDRGGIIVSSSHPTYIFNISRLTLFNNFKIDVKERLEGIYCRRKYYLQISDVDAAISSGGSIVFTKSELIAKIVNKMDQ